MSDDIQATPPNHHLWHPFSFCLYTSPASIWRREWLNQRCLFFHSEVFKRLLAISPMAQPLEKPTTSLESPEAPENNTQQTETKSLVVWIQIPQVTAGRC